MGDYEKRTRILEDAGAFFKRNEDWLADNINSSNLKVKGALERFDKETQNYLVTLQDSLNQQILKFNGIITKQQENLKVTLEKTNEIVAISLSENQKLFEKAINYQQKIFESKLEETTTLIDEIKAISHIKDGIKSFEKETKKQNDKIDALTKEIRNLVKSKSSQNWTPVPIQNGGNTTNGEKKKAPWTERLKKNLTKTFSNNKK